MERVSRTPCFEACAGFLHHESAIGARRKLNICLLIPASVCVQVNGGTLNGRKGGRRANRLLLYDAARVLLALELFSWGTECGCDPRGGPHSAILEIASGNAQDAIQCGRRGPSPRFRA